jgi:hypothetical protein
VDGLRTLHHDRWFPYEEAQQYHAVLTLHEMTPEPNLSGRERRRSGLKEGLFPFSYLLSLHLQSALYSQRPNGLQKTHHS